MTMTETKRLACLANLAKANTPEAKAKMSIKMSDRCSKSHWWNNGLKEKFKPECPAGYTKGRLPFNESTKLKISNSIKGENNPFYGKHHTEDTKAKLSFTRTTKGLKWNELARTNALKSRKINLIHKYGEELYEMISNESRLLDFILELPIESRTIIDSYELLMKMYPDSKLPLTSYHHYLTDKIRSNMKIYPGFYKSSHYEYHLGKFLASVIKDENKILYNKRPDFMKVNGKCRELDLWIPDYNLAIEFNGLQSHSKVSINYHKIKTDKCRSEGIQLIHIYEHEWIKDKVKIKNYLQSLLTNKLKIVNGVKVFRFDKDNFNVVNNFVNKYSFDSLNYDIAYGLRDNNRLYAVMTFRLINENDYEVFICKSYNYDVDNYLHLILDKFKVDSNPNKLIYYCNYSKFNDKDITNLNFKFDSESINRKFVNYNLDEIDYSENLVEDCKSKGYYLVTDAGVGKYIYDDILNNDKTRRFRRI